MPYQKKKRPSQRLFFHTSIFPILNSEYPRLSASRCATFVYCVSVTTFAIHHPVMATRSVITMKRNTHEKDDDVLVSSAHSERMLSLLESGVGDLTILAGKLKTPIRVQKMFLTAASPVFRKMYTTTGDNDDGFSGKDKFVQTLELPEMTKEEVMMFMKFLYAGTKPDKVESALPLLRAATTYEIPDLGKHCAKILETKLSDESVLHIYEQARLYNNEHLKKSTMEYICMNASNIVKLKHFMEISVEALAQILEQDALAVIDEAQLFDGVIRWAHAEIQRQRAQNTPTNIRSVLEKVIRLIRFPQMTPFEFASRVITSQVLSSDEIVAALLYYSVPEDQRSALPRGLFSTRPRQYFRSSPSGKEYQVSCEYAIMISDRAIASRPLFIAMPSCTIRFKVNTQIWIRRVHVDFTFTPPTRNSQSYDSITGGYKYNYKHSYNVFPFNPSDVLKILIEGGGNSLKQISKSVNFSKTDPTGPNCRSVLTVPLDTDLCIPKNTQFHITFAVNSNLLRERRYVGNAGSVVISTVYEEANGQNEKVEFEFDETDDKPFFVGFSFDFLVN